MPACRRHYPGRFDGTDSLVPFHRRRPSPHYSWSAPASQVSRPAQRSRGLQPADLPSRLLRPSTPEAPAALLPPPPLRLLPGGAIQFPGGSFFPLWTSAFSRRTVRACSRQLTTLCDTCETCTSTSYDRLVRTPRPARER